MLRWAILAALSAGLVADAPGALRENGVWVAMKDGARLKTNVFRPVSRLKLGTIFFRTPYGAGTEIPPGWQAFLDAGFAIVTQDIRGRSGSDGRFHDISVEEQDGSRTIDWIAAQPCSNGCVGMLGGSYRGILQWRAALSRNSHLCAIAPSVSGWDEYVDRYYSPGGAFRLGQRLQWVTANFGGTGKFDENVRHRPLRTADVAATGGTVPLWQDVMAHPERDRYWKELSTRERIDQVKIPTYILGGWYDPFVASDLAAFSELKRRGRDTRIVIGPWTHDPSHRFEKLPFGDKVNIPLRRAQVAWFQQHLAPTGGQPKFFEPTIRYFLMGANEWRAAETWPPEPTQQTSLYLHQSKELRWTRTRAEGEDTFVFDPRNPVPSLGGNTCCDPRVMPWGPVDQRVIGPRKDVLTYTTAPLAQPLDIAGPVAIRLQVATSAKDTDFTAKLVDVFPGGEARILTDGILRLRYRDGLGTTKLAVPGQFYRVTIDMGVTANRFLAGHRLRLEISSSNFPKFDLNPNTGTEIASETRVQSARQRVKWGGEFVFWRLKR